MKHILVLLTIVLLITGCGFSNPITGTHREPPMDKELIDLAYTPNDEFFYLKHEMDTMSVSTAWDIMFHPSVVLDEDIIVAVIDTGVDRDHPDLNVLAGMDFVDGGDGYGGQVPGDGIDNDGDGISDETVGHGTMMAGMIAACMDNFIGSCGVAPNISILPINAFNTNGDYGATFNSVINSVLYATSYDGVKVINMSFATIYDSSELRAVLRDAYNAGIILVAAAGNDHCDTPVYPAAYPEVIGVAALNQSFKKASFSNYGHWVDLAAPGCNIHSTHYNNIYSFSSGTSNACALASGSFAALVMVNPNLPPSVYRAIMDYTLTPVYDEDDENFYDIGGCINLYDAVMMLNGGPPLI
jgi:subtilisin family serine protease